MESSKRTESAARRRKAREVIQESRRTITIDDLHDFLLEETNASGAAQADYIYLDGRPIATMNPSTGALYFLHDDMLGTPQLATDASKAVAWQASYQPFGTTSSVSGTITQNLRFPGQYFDVESGWNHNGFRDYLPDLGRYAEPDPLALLGSARYYHPTVGGFTSDVPINFFGGGINFYTYVFENPINYKDPTGKVCIYSQTTGSMMCYPMCKKLPPANSCSKHAELGKPYYNDHGYSGTGRGRNNPDAQDESYVGPIPRGTWIATGGWYNKRPRPGTNIMNLEPIGGGENCFGTGRECQTFRMHGNNAANDASEGCLVLPPNRTIIPSGETVEVTE